MPTNPPELKSEDGSGSKPPDDQLPAELHLGVLSVAERAIRRAGVLRYEYVMFATRWRPAVRTAVAAIVTAVIGFATAVAARAPPLAGRRGPPRRAAHGGARRSADPRCQPALDRDRDR